MHEATVALIVILGLLILDMALTVATFASLAARIRDLHDEVTAARLARNDLDRRTLGDPRNRGQHRRDGGV
jgi:hypothetical protein